MYTPDNWIVFEKIYDGKPERFVVGGWSGGYLDGDSWRRNSGVESVIQDENFLYFHGYSGSIYKCHKKHNEVRINIAHVMQEIESHDDVKIISAETILEELDEESKTKES